MERQNDWSAPLVTLAVLLLFAGAGIWSGLDARRARQQVLELRHENERLKANVKYLHAQAEADAEAIKAYRGGMMTTAKMLDKLNAELKACREQCKREEQTRVHGRRQLPAGGVSRATALPAIEGDRASSGRGWIAWSFTNNSAQG